MRSHQKLATRRSSRAAVSFFCRPVSSRLAFWLTISACLMVSSRCLADDEIIEWRGNTMGTTYQVKVASPQTLPEDTGILIDAELRRVNDQMSTYLRGSEISRFNDSDSTDWFSVSEEFATVVQYAQAVAQKTDGAFDITVGPLVDAWNFGPNPQRDQIPDEQTLQLLQQKVGYQHLQVRLDPPALKKDLPGLRIDLSSIAKGHGVDRVVDLLNAGGAANVFVEIGGEIRTTGSKPQGPWMVGVQDPDVSGNHPALAKPLNDRAIATSGDYRNFYLIDGVRYSHTIDPRTAKPVDHELASVSVIADLCMHADAWATAINVLGADRAAQLAESNGLEILTFNRADNGFEILATGAFRDDATRLNERYAESKDISEQTSPSTARSFVAIALVTLVFFSVVIVGMAVGVIFGRKAIGGSCGGLANRENEDGSTSCSLCSNPSDACKELREKMQQNSSSPASL